MPKYTLFSFVALTRKKLASLRCMYRHLGVMGLIHVLTHRIINRFVVMRNYKCLVLDPTGIAAVRIERKPGFTFREILPDELDRYTSNEAYELTGKFLAQVKSRGDRCYGAFSGGTLVSYSFYASTSTDVDKFLKFHFPRGMCYVYKVFTLPAWRGQRLHSMALSVAIQSLRERGICTFGFTTAIQSCNYASLKSFQRLGFQELGNHRVLGIAKWRIVLGSRRGQVRDFAITRNH